MNLLVGKNMAILVSGIAMIVFLLILFQPEYTNQLSLEITPTIDRLAIPTLPPDPSQVDKGRYLYYFHCMPCHGDRGQGLTDEWRDVWEVDHQNCWARGCHGKNQPASVLIPTIVPSVISLSQLREFSTSNDLFNYLKDTHPPQKPGSLEDDEYHDLVVFLFKENNRTGYNQNINERLILVFFLLILTTIALSIISAVILKSRSRKPTNERNNR